MANGVGAVALVLCKKGILQPNIVPLNETKKRTRTVPFTYSVEYAQTRGIRKAWPNALRLQKHGQKCTKKTEFYSKNRRTKKKKKLLGKRNRDNQQQQRQAKTHTKKKKKGIA